ncbi:hypothetical protein VULLAG_LOCUS7432 [Vulpes lagopus]
MDEQQENKMARTPGQAPGSGRSGSGTRAPSRWPVSQVGEVLSGYREGTPGKTRRVGRSRGTGQGPQGEDVGGPRERGVTRKPGEKGALTEGRPPSPPSPPSRLQRGRRAATGCSPVRPREHRLGGPPTATTPALLHLWEAPLPFGVHA